MGREGVGGAVLFADGLVERVEVVVEVEEAVKLIHEVAGDGTGWMVSGG